MGVVNTGASGERTWQPWSKDSAAQWALPQKALLGLESKPAALPQAEGAKGESKRERVCVCVCVCLHLTLDYVSVRLERHHQEIIFFHVLVHKIINQDTSQLLPNSHAN